MVAASPRSAASNQPSAYEAAAYIESLVGELALLAANAGLPSLAFRLEHARSAAAEAAAVFQDAGGRAAYPPASDTA
jgi:hypothetical protein